MKYNFYLSFLFFQNPDVEVFLMELFYRTELKLSTLA